MVSPATGRPRSRAGLAALGAAICVAALLLAGCGGGGGSVVRRDLTAASPLAEFLGTTPRSQLGLPHLDEQERERQDALTDLVAQCMTDAGFEYVAVSMADRLGQAFLDAYTLAPAEFARQYGYGVTTIEANDFDDPNERLRDELAPAERAEYDRALWGEPGSGGGCYLRASAEVYGDPADPEAGYAEFGDLSDRINELYQRIDDDPRLHEAHRRWAACLAGAGHPGFTAPPDARQSVFDRLPGPVAGAPAAADPEQLAEVRGYELALAPVDHECQRRHVDGPRRLVTIELERAFIEEHRAELERYRDWLAG